MVDVDSKPPSVKNLKKLFENLDEALDNAPADLGASHYPKAKKRTLTLSLKRRERSYQDLKSIFENPAAKTQQPAPKKPVVKGKEEKELLQKLLADLDVDEKKKEEPKPEAPKEEPKPEAPKEEPKPEVTNEESKPEPPKEEPKSEPPKEEPEETPSVQTEEKKENPSFLEEPTISSDLKEEKPQEEKKEEPASKSYEENNHQGNSQSTDDLQDQEPEQIFIRTDKDLVSILMDVIHEAFYNPHTGLWPTYDLHFDRSYYTSFGKPGWDSPQDTEERLNARELINREKNLEIERLLNGDFVKNATEQIYEQISSLVTGVKRRDVRRGIKNHIRVHLYYLIYGQETVLNNSRFKE